MTINIKGVIGSDVTGQAFADKLARLQGDIDFEIDSPGGSVFHGISIYNAIKNYNRGKCRMHVVGDCSSMAAYIMLAGDGDVEFEPNSIVVLHNPWSFAIGDYRDMQKEAGILERLSALYAKAFVERGLFEEAEIRSIMDEETWFIGAESLKKLGKVLGDEKEDSDDGDKEIKIAGLRERMDEAKAKIRALKNGDEPDKIAALLPKETGVNAHHGKSYNANIYQISAGKQDKKEKGENKMVASLEELKTQNASIYNEAKAEGEKAEKKRVAALMKFIDIDAKAVEKAIEDGSHVNDDEFQAAILAARTNKKEIQSMEKENPAGVDPKAEIHEPENKQNGEPTEEEKKKAQQEEEDKKFNAILSAMGIQSEKAEK